METSPDYWHAVCPDLRLCAGDGPVTERLEPHAITAAHLGQASESMNASGYLCLPYVLPIDDCLRVADGITSLRKQNIPAVMIYLYDEPWTLFRKLSPLVAHFLGDGFKVLPHFWAWYVPPEKGAAGWPAHQDCQARTRFDDGFGGATLMSMSLWVALSDATLENGCMAVHPLDTTLHDDKTKGVPLPVGTGGVLGWGQDVWHWSRTVTDNAEHPRVSMSFEFQNAAFQPLREPLLDLCNPPPFAERLKIIEEQFARYKHMEA